MSVYLKFESEQFGEQIASTSGWTDVKGWADDLGVSGYKQLHHLIRFGWCQDIPKLLRQTRKGLDNNPPEKDVIRTLHGMLKILNKRKGAHSVFLGNGLGTSPGGETVTDNTYNPDQPRDSKGQFGSGDSTKRIGGVLLKDIIGTDITTKEDKTRGGRLLDRVKGGYSRVKEGMSKAGQAVYDKLPTPLQKTLQLAKFVEHKLDKAYASAQVLAKEVARQRGHSEEHVERVAKVMAVCDGIQRWSVNVPALHTALHTFAEIGGPVGFIAAKAGFYVPVASLAYVAQSMAKETIAGKNPFKMVNEARKRVRDSMGKEEHSHTTNTYKGVINSKLLRNSYKVQFADDCLCWLTRIKADLTLSGTTSQTITDKMDYVLALLVGAADETGGDLEATLRYARQAYTRQPLPPVLEPLEAIASVQVESRKPPEPDTIRQIPPTNSQDTSTPDLLHNHWQSQDDEVYLASRDIPGIDVTDTKLYEEVAREIYTLRKTQNPQAHSTYYSKEDHEKYDAGGSDHPELKTI